MPDKPPDFGPLADALERFLTLADIEYSAPDSKSRLGALRFQPAGRIQHMLRRAGLEVEKKWIALGDPPVAHHSEAGPWPENARLAVEWLVPIFVCDIFARWKFVRRRGAGKGGVVTFPHSIDYSKYVDTDEMALFPEEARSLRWALDLLRMSAMSGPSGDQPSVRLGGGPDDPVYVFGKRKVPLGPVRHPLIRVLLNAFPDRILTRNLTRELKAERGQKSAGDWRNTLDAMRENDADWWEAIVMPPKGSRHVGYGIREA